jgi:hypothetical protein
MEIQRPVAFRPTLTDGLALSVTSTITQTHEKRKLYFEELPFPFFHPRENINILLIKSIS